MCRRLTCSNSSTNGIFSDSCIEFSYFWKTKGNKVISTRFFDKSVFSKNAIFFFITKTSCFSEVLNFCQFFKMCEKFQIFFEILNCKYNKLNFPVCWCKFLSAALVPQKPKMTITSELFLLEHFVVWFPHGKRVISTDFFDAGSHLSTGFHCLILSHQCLSRPLLSWGGPCKRKILFFASESCETENARIVGNNFDF